MDLVDALGEFVKAGPHKYRARRRGKGGRWEYDYGDGYGLKTGRVPVEQKRVTALDPKTAVLQGEFEAAVAAGKFRGSFEQHVRIAKSELTAHDADRGALVESLGELSGGKGKVKARTKKLDSVLGKMLRKPKYKDASMLQDLTGARIVHENVADVKKTVAAIRRKYKVVDEDNYIDTPLGDYRSWHLIIEHNGKQKEIQVRTGNQDTFADWAHDIYKTQTPAQDAAMKTNAPEIETYSKQGAAFFWAADSGRSLHPPHPPPCTRLVKNAFGCLDFGGS